MTRWIAGALSLVLAAGGASAEEAAPTPKPVNRTPAQIAAPGPVGRLALAQGLFAASLSQRDPVGMIAAARITLAVPVRDKDRKPETIAPTEPVPTTGTSAQPFDAAAMLRAARALAAGDEAVLAQADAAEAEGAGQVIGGPARTRARIAPGSEDRWTMAFYSAALAEVAVLAGGDASLELTVTDGDGNVICALPGDGPANLCGWVPDWNATFTVAVRNPGPATVAYWLLTD